MSEPSSGLSSVALYNAMSTPTCLHYGHYILCNLSAAHCQTLDDVRQVAHCERWMVPSTPE